MSTRAFIAALAASMLAGCDRTVIQHEPGDDPTTGYIVHPRTQQKIPVRYVKLNGRDDSGGHGWAGYENGKWQVFLRVD